VDDRDPPQAASSRLPEAETDLDPAVVRPNAERRRGATSAVAGDAYLLVRAAAVVAAGVGGCGGEREQAEREENEPCHRASVR
jgi:hypothetical protein